MNVNKTFRKSGPFNTSLILLLLIISYNGLFAQNPEKSNSSAIADFENLPKVKWEFKTALPIFSSPVISENMVYFGGNDSLLHAVNIESGK